MTFVCVVCEGSRNGVLEESACPGPQLIPEWDPEIVSSVNDRRKLFLMVNKQKFVLFLKSEIFLLSFKMSKSSNTLRPEFD